MAAQSRDSGLARSLSALLVKQIKESRVLLVGAGGIGCEVLKNLVCCGFGSAHTRSTTNGETNEAREAELKPGITLIDLDTIDLSNLNRQFLFRKQHIKQPKAIVAKDTASTFNPSVNIDARHASIFDQQFNVEFFESFNIVFNALDNVAARRHVNRMCLAAGVPLIESGTTGYNGQVQAIKKGVTECYDCNEKPVQKSFAICTIRSTPSQPIHCIVWAKSYLLPELFGVSEDQGKDMTETSEDNAQEVAKLKEEAQALQKIKSMMHESGFVKAVWDKVYVQDITRLASMEEMWKGKAKPAPLPFGENIWTSDPVTRGQSVSKDMQRVWTMEENAAVFCYSLDALVARVKNGETTIEFDKDDKDTLDFVTAAANLRAHIFDIDLNSAWQTKQMAGNIIPAIATSNAMTASLCVSQSFKIMRAAVASALSQNGAKSLKTSPPMGTCKMTFLTSKNTERMITTEALRPPNPHCPVCSPVYAKLSIPNTAPTLQDLVDLIRASTKLEDFSITVSATKQLIYDPEEEDNLVKPLSDFSIESASNDFVIVQDEDNKVPLLLSMAPLMEGDALRIVPANIELPNKATPPVTEMPSAQLVSSLKRKRENDDHDEIGEMKKPKTNGSAVVTEVIEIDNNDGAILLDD